MNDYARWKRWAPERFAPYSPGAHFFFERLKYKYSLPPGAACEIGFGNGELLRALRSHYDSVLGIERIEQLADAARTSLGVEAYCGACWTLPSSNARFDLVIGLNVLEHMDWTELQLTFDWLSRCLRPGGMAIFQFPEGASPLGLGNFHGDFTHKTPLTRGKVDALSIEAILEIVAYDIDPLYSNLLSRSLLGRALIRTIDCFRTLYSETLRILARPLARNVLFRENSVLVLKKRSTSKALSTQR